MVQEFDSSDMTDVFPQDIEGLPDALPPALVDLDDGDLLEMRIGPVRNSIGGEQRFDPWAGLQGQTGHNGEREGHQRRRPPPNCALAWPSS
jgi:hypothetical protein